ncbi:aldose epimerase family protein [Companilactobacillus alimentarius]|uniref:aldose epimerase family protein n=1 Tax=Companilactobacillus alimentarius TaxID=1602 RepID=UPI0028B78E01|nr:aldose epimerase family protein [Companilactobacillus alimentarius]MDT6951654.1 aldose epimerase family protein [Companilactobacillus alimentarius]
MTLQNDNGMIVKLLNYGATLEKVMVPDHGKLINLILSLDYPEDYDKERNFLGGTVGRVIGRIKSGLWQKNDTKAYHFELNENNITHSHGGKRGLDTRIFDFKVNQSEFDCSASFHYLDLDGNNNYPGNLDITVKYTLNNQDTLFYSVLAVTDATTLCNIANHVYFCLDGPKSNIKNNLLMINADQYLPLDKDHIPLASTQNVADSCFDFRNERILNQALGSSDSQIKHENGLNHPFILNNNSAPAVKLYSSDRRRSMILRTTAPAIVVYTGNHFNHTGLTHDFNQYGGIALEAQIPPSSSNDLRDMILRPNEKYLTQTSWNFKY